MPSIVRSIQKFSSALNIAIYDRSLELENVKPIFFHDADVVYKLIMGFWHEYPRPKKEASRQRLVRSLLSIGLLGKIHLLRPHALELFERLRIEEDKWGSIEQGVYQRKALGYVRETNTYDLMESLCDLVCGDKPESQRKEQDIIDQFINIMKRQSGDTFAYIEQINGIWSNRFRRYVEQGTLHTDIFGSELFQLSESDNGLLRNFFREVKVARDPQLSLNAYQDAFALTLLSGFIENGITGYSEGVPRFYTETKSLENTILKNPELSRRLISKNEHPDITGLFEVEHLVILRNTDYFLVRIMFPELHFRAGASESTRLDYVQGLNERLLDMLASDEEIIEDKFRQESYEGDNLVDIISSFERLLILDNLWVRGKDTPDFLKSFETLNQWLQVFEFARGKKFANTLHSQITELKNKFELNLQETRSWTSNYRSILSASKDVAKRFNRVADPMRDLGLVRWNYEISDKEKQEIVELLEIVEEGSQEELSTFAEILATKIEIAKNNPKELQFVCAILWALNLFKAIVDLVDRAMAINPDSISPATLIIRSAAAMRTGDVKSADVRHQIVADVANVLETAPHDQRKGLLLGAGYIYYHCWKQEMINKNTNQRLFINQDEHVRTHAKKSFELGLEAYESFNEHELAWAFAINHCAYVGFVTDVDTKKGREFVKLLSRLKGYSAIWSPRFDDTIGTYYLTEAEREWASPYKESIDITSIQDNINNAKEFLNLAKSKDPGDIDIEDHLVRVDTLEDTIRDELKSEGGENTNNSADE